MKKAMLFVIFFLCGVVAAEEFAPGYYVRIGRSYRELMPFGELTTCPPDLAIRLMKNLQVASMGHPVDDPKARHLEASRLLAQNPNLPWSVDAELERIPELMENFYLRENLIRGLGQLPAEWSVRKLMELATREVNPKSEEFDLTDQAEIKKLFLRDSSMDFVERTNPGHAVLILKHMELPGWLDTLDSQVPMQLRPGSPHGFDSHNHILRVARWIELNEDRIPDMVRQKWGEIAVMNADIGLGPDNLPLAADGSSPTRSRESKRTTLPGNKPRISQEENMQFWPVAGLIFFSLISVLAVWLLRRRGLTNAG
jgi:hypothetical protein